MKNILTSFFLLPIITFGQLTTNSFQHNGVNREYKTYVPSSYDGSVPVPIVLCLHGLGDNMTNFTGIGMNYVADTANFIVVTPQALLETQFTNATAWNSGAGMFGFTLNSNVDDIGFLSDLIDTIAANYNVDLERVFSCGFSMGGFMSQRLACELNGKIAAVASVAGTIGSGITCNPQRPVPVCHFHGTGDSTVNYTGNQYGMDAEAMVAYWSNQNGCSSGPTTTSLPDLFVDGYTVEHTLYSSCNENAEVELFRVDSADHIWLGPSNDIFYTTEIWKFFMKHYHHNLGTEELQPIQSIVISPNPASDNTLINIESTLNENALLSLIDVTGKIVKTSTIQLHHGNTQFNLSLSGFDTGIYFLNIQTENSKYSKKLIINQ